MESDELDENSEAAFASGPKHDPNQFLDLYGDYLFGFAMSRVDNVSLAEDLVQETLMKAINKIDSFRGDASIKTWMVSILRNEISTHFRRKQTAEKHQESLEQEAAGLEKLLHPDISNSEFSTAIEREEFWAVIEECYTRIPAHLLEVFLAKMHSDGENVEDLSNRLGISASNFSVRIFRTRLMLRKCIEAKWLQGDN